MKWLMVVVLLIAIAAAVGISLHPDSPYYQWWETEPTPTEGTLTQSSEASQDGTAAASWASTSGAIIVGDDDVGNGRQAFFSFWIEDIPDGATIDGARIFWPHPPVDHRGDPFGDLGLGRLYVYNDQYRDLEESDYVDVYNPPPSDALGSYSSIPTGSLTVTNAVQQQVGVHTRFQIRLQFEFETNGDSTRDQLTFPEGAERPKLSIEYTFTP